LFGALLFGLLFGPFFVYALAFPRTLWAFFAPVFGLVLALVFGLLFGLLKRSAVSSRLTLVWPSTKRQLLDFLRRAGRGLAFGLIGGMFLGLAWGLLPAMIVLAEGSLLVCPSAGGGGL
jgi:sulfite exporter TauE/SafE